MNVPNYRYSWGGHVSCIQRKNGWMFDTRINWYRHHFCLDTVPLQVRALVSARQMQKLPCLTHKLSRQHQLAEFPCASTCQSTLCSHSGGQLRMSVKGTRLTLPDQRWYSSDGHHYRKCRVWRKSMHAVIAHTWVSWLLSTLANHLPEEEDEEDGEPEKHDHWSWLRWLPWIYVAWVLYTNSNKEPPIPEVYFPSFIKHMLMTGEVSSKHMVYQRITFKELYTVDT